MDIRTNSCAVLCGRALYLKCIFKIQSKMSEAKQLIYSWDLANLDRCGMKKVWIVGPCIQLVKSHKIRMFRIRMKRMFLIHPPRYSNSTVTMFLPPGQLLALIHPGLSMTCHWLGKREQGVGKENDPLERTSWLGRPCHYGINDNEIYCVWHVYTVREIHDTQ